MRDKKRIPRIIKLVEEYWKLYPDMRLGQVISSIGMDLGLDKEIFYLEDNHLEDELKKQLKKEKIKEEPKKEEKN